MANNFAFGRRRGRGPWLVRTPHPSSSWTPRRATTHHRPTAGAAVWGIQTHRLSIIIVRDLVAFLLDEATSALLRSRSANSCAAKHEQRIAINGGFYSLVSMRLIRTIDIDSTRFSF